MTLMLSEAAFPSASEFTPAGLVDVISYATSNCVLGQVLVARSDRGVCSILIGDDAEQLAEDLAAGFPKATLVASDVIVRDDMTKVLRFIENPAEGLHLSLDMRGTPLQRRIWEKLRGIPPGHSVTYM